jgi:hypothetical protein
MSEKNLTSAVAYYQAMNNKDLYTIEKFLHPDVRLISPLADITGKEDVFNSVRHFLAVFNTLTVRAQFSSGTQAMLAYDLDCPAPIGLYRGAVLLTFQEDLIIRYELFYDTKPLAKKKDEIFARS